MSQDQKIVRIAGIRQACGECSLFELCLPVTLDTEDVALLDDIVQRRRPLSRGDRLYRNGDAFASIYVVRSGALKTLTVTEEGDEQVTGFHLPGEIVGLDAISRGAHPCEAVALETTSVCEIPFTELEGLAARIPGLQHQLLRIMSKEIFEEQSMLQAVAKRTAEERLAIVLLSLSSRFGQRGLSSVCFHLPMSRSDLSNYLGLAPETMSRLFKRFQSMDLLKCEAKEVTLLDMDALYQMSLGGGNAGSAYSGRGGRL